MGHPAVAIPEKIFFKIGEVCEIVDVQAHVLRYWETEFSMLSPQKNRSGQRSYRRRDVEIALRIKELLYDELYTIAGAKKKLQSELRESSRLKIVPSDPQPEPRPETFIQPVQLPLVEPEDELEVDDELESEIETIEHYDEEMPPVALDRDRRQALADLASQLLELREMLKDRKSGEPGTYQRRY